jgi:hypothetical protein
MPSRQESTYCREGESIEMAQKRISTKSQDSATATKTQHTYHHKNEEEQTADSFPQAIKNKITMLLGVIDQIDSDFKQARELILEIAKRLDEEGLSQVSHAAPPFPSDKQFGRGE